MRRKDAVGDGEPDLYVVCLECGRHLMYDSNRGRIGKPLAVEH